MFHFSSAIKKKEKKVSPLKPKSLKSFAEEKEMHSDDTNFESSSITPIITLDDAKLDDILSKEGEIDTLKAVNVKKFILDLQRYD